MIAPTHPRSTFFPYTTLFRSTGRVLDNGDLALARAFADHATLALENAHLYAEARRRRHEAEELARVARDRKSTRLNSSHRCISYAVFCLKKKNKREQNKRTKM